MVGNFCMGQWLVSERIADMDFEEMTEELEKDKRFGRGVMVGILGTIVSCAVLLAAFTIFTDSRIDIRSSGSGKRTAGVETALSDKVLQKINELMGYIHLYFYDDVEEEQLADGIYSGLMQGLDDRYTEYYTPEEYADLQISATQNYYGIGAQLSQDRDSMQVTITHVYEGSPAEAAGLKDGDIVVMVEDIESTSMELSELVTHIRGEEGTTVHLQIYRDGDNDYQEFDVERANIDLPTIEHKMLGEAVGYIHILEFGEPTVEQFEHAVG